MKNASATAYIRELCALGLSGELLIPALLDALHRVIPSAHNLFDWVDSEGRILRYYFEGPIDHQTARLYFDEFHNRREAEAMPRYVDVIGGNATIRSAEELNHRHFFESALYQEIWRPQRLHFRLEAIVRNAEGRAMGSLVLYRSQGERIFTRDDESTLATLVPYVARGLMRGRERQVEYTARRQPPVLVNLDGDGRIVHMSRDAHRVLLLAHGGISPAAAASPASSEQFASLALLHRQLVRTGDEAPCALSLTNAWGRFDFHAERLHAAPPQADLIGVTVQHLVPRPARVLAALEDSPLSIAQKKVCTLLMQGLTQAQIAARLSVSASTVTDHIRKIYRKLDLHSVDELRDRFDAAPHSR